MTQKEFLLDFSNCNNLDDAYHVFNNKIGFSEFGFNLSALIDILRGGFGHFEYDEDITLIILGQNNAEDKVEDWDEIKKIMDEAENVTVLFRT
jgi:RNAse (barnase) inhibitor barstar